MHIVQAREKFEKYLGLSLVAIRTTKLEKHGWYCKVKKFSLDLTIKYILQPINNKLSKVMIQLVQQKDV